MQRKHSWLKKVLTAMGVRFTSCSYVEMTHLRFKRACVIMHFNLMR